MGRVKNVESLEDLEPYGRKKPLEGISCGVSLSFLFFERTLWLQR